MAIHIHLHRAPTKDASPAYAEAVRYYNSVKSNNPKSRVSWQSVAKEISKAMGTATGNEKSELQKLLKEAENLAATLPRPGVPNVGAYAHLAK